MRLPVFATTGLSVTAALLLLTGCGGSDTDSAASSSSSASSGASSGAQSGASSSTSPAGSNSGAPAAGSPDEETLTFCTEAEAVLTEVGPAVESATPETIPSALQQVVDGFDTLSPPAAIETDFGTLRDAYATLLDAATANDLTTPEGEAAFQSTFSEVTGEATTAESSVGDWISTNCPNAGSSPTS